MPSTTYVPPARQHGKLAHVAVIHTHYWCLGGPQPGLVGWGVARGGVKGRARSGRNVVSPIAGQFSADRTFLPQHSAKRSDPRSWSGMSDVWTGYDRIAGPEAAAGVREGHQRRAPTVRASAHACRHTGHVAQRYPGAEGECGGRQARVEGPSRVAPVGSMGRGGKGREGRWGGLRGGSGPECFVSPASCACRIEPVAHIQAAHETHTLPPAPPRSLLSPRHVTLSISTRRLPDPPAHPAACVELGSCGRPPGAQ